ncbi:MAG TPA: 16S rRNA (cytidine(1402)-2'-O)-methyltransferase [Solirubrobacteraceae bacterium]|nr:16S rRNA (cytidine(1402)-2'-O)-methyltransferase [Solirubrobacteraceae bacterium]
MTPAEVAGGRLLLCPTPIGNLGDVTLRVLQALREADLIACEDTRHTRVLLERHEIRARLASLHEHNERSRARELAERIGAGATVALVSDAGTPLVSDPGFALVQECLAAGLPVEVLPGASAVITALVASGLPAERWCFAGFLPRKRGELERLLGQAEQTLVAFESPRRLAATLATLAALDPGRPVAVCRELTKLHEEVRRGGAAELAEHFAAAPARGEIVLVVGAPAGSGGIALQDALVALRELVDAGARARPAASALAKLTGLGANELYRGLTQPGPGRGGNPSGQ